MLETSLASLWIPANERAIPSPSETDRTQSIIDELQRVLDFENSVKEDISEMATDQQRRTRIPEEELQKRKPFIAPIRKVPEDVLVEILDLALIGSRRQIWRFSHVCRHWRYVCCSYAWLWSHIEVNIAVDHPHVGLVSKWRERAWATNQIIDLRLHLEQFGALKCMLEGGLKYITHLRLTIPCVAIEVPEFDLPPALPCLRHLALKNDEMECPFSFFDTRVYITSLCHRFFTRKQTRRTGSVARFHLEFHNLAFKKPPLVMNCVHTVVLRRCTFGRPSQILQFLEAAKFAIKHLEYIDCWFMYFEMPPRTRTLTFPLLLTLKHYSYKNDQFEILSILSCPALNDLTIDQRETSRCTVARYPAIQELCLVAWKFKDAKYVDCPLLRDSRQLETFTISQRHPTALSPDQHSSMVCHYKRANLDNYSGSLRRFRFHFPHVRGSVEQFESGLREVTDAFARGGRDMKFELIQGGDCGISLCKDDL